MIQAAVTGCFFHTPGKAQTGLDRDGFRSQVEGFGRSEASSTTWENKKQQVIIDRFTQRMESNGYHVLGFSDYVGDARTLEEMQSAFEKISQLYPDESKGLTIALNYPDDPDTLGWFDPKTGRIHFSREQFKNWEAAQKEYEGLVKVGFFPKGTDLRGCFYHEFGHSFSYQHGWKSYRKTVDQALEGLGYGYMSVPLRESALRKELSKYATSETNPLYQEVIAECFSEWYTSDEPRQFCELFYERRERYEHERPSKKVFFKSNPEWVWYDENELPHLTDKAPPEAVESYNYWKKWYEKCQRDGIIYD